MNTEIDLDHYVQDTQLLYSHVQGAIPLGLVMTIVKTINMQKARISKTHRYPFVIGGAHFQGLLISAFYTFSDEKTSELFVGFVEKSYGGIRYSFVFVTCKDDENNTNIEIYMIDHDFRNAILSELGGNVIATARTDS